MVLELSAAQLAELDRLEGQQFVDEIRRSLVSDFPELVTDETLGPRLERACEHAETVLGFRDGEALTQFLYYEVFAPGFYLEPAIDAWLCRPGQPVERRFEDLLAVMKSKLREG